MPNNVTVTIISATLAHIRRHHIHRISTATTTTQKNTILLTQPNPAIRGTGLERGGHGKRPRASHRRQSARRQQPPSNRRRHPPPRNALSRVSPLTPLPRQSRTIGTNHRLRFASQPLKAGLANLL